MRPPLPLILILVALPHGAVAQTVPAFPAGALETEARILARASPQTRAWVREESIREHNAGTVSEEAARKAAAGYRPLGDTTGNEAIAFLVLMSTARQAQEDLRSITAGIKKINEARAVQKPKADRPASVATNPRATPSTVAPMPASRAATSAVGPKPLSRAEFERRFDQARNDPVALDSMSDMEMLRLQMAMDRLSKLMSILSNLLKKVSETSSGIVQNIK